MASLGELFDVSQGKVTGLSVLEDDLGVITVAQDRSVRIWLKRSNGQYWPSVCHFLNSPCTTLHVHTESRTVLVGTETGTIYYYELSSDLNILKSIRTLNAHSLSVIDCCYCPLHKWVLSVGGDSTFVWSELKSGNTIGKAALISKPTCFQFDSESGFIFYGDDKGLVIIMRLRPCSTVDPVVTLDRHIGAIGCLHWDSSSQKLFSASKKESKIICWDIGGRKGHFVELNGHTSLVKTIFTNNYFMYSMSACGKMVTWDMKQKRENAGEWAESNSCQTCNNPFFWNVKQMWNDTKIGVRQHHCRSCGKALCEKCSLQRTTIPTKGFEFTPVRVCLGCYENITDNDSKSFAKETQISADVSDGDVSLTVNRLAVLNNSSKILLFDFSYFV